MTIRSGLLVLLMLMPALAPVTEAGPIQQPANPAQAEPPQGQSTAPAQKADASAIVPENATATAPETFRVRFDTTKGPFVVEVIREWAPNGADRFYNLVKLGYFTDVAFFRIVSGFMAQFGIHGDPAIAAKWKKATILDDPVKQSNQRGFITYAASRAQNSRTTQMFINYTNNARLDNMRFAPFGRVIQGMDVVDILHADYGDGAPRGRGPNQARIESQGNQYLREAFPLLDYIKSATLVE